AEIDTLSLHDALPIARLTVTPMRAQKALRRKVRLASPERSRGLSSSSLGAGRWGSGSPSIWLTSKTYTVLKPTNTRSSESSGSCLSRDPRMATLYLDKCQLGSRGANADYSARCSSCQ